MKHYKILLVILTILTLLTGCSTSSVQSKRLDTAEELIIQTERDLTSTIGDTNKLKAQEKLGTANAYLATLKDYQKSLTKEELERYKALTKKSDALSKRAAL